MADFTSVTPLTHALPEVRAAPARYMTRKGYADLLDMLGLEPPAGPITAPARAGQEADRD